jgi:hypothetical protein
LIFNRAFLEKRSVEDSNEVWLASKRHKRDLNPSIADYDSADIGGFRMHLDDAMQNLSLDCPSLYDSLCRKCSESHVSGSDFLDHLATCLLNETFMPHIIDHFRVLIVDLVARLVDRVKLDLASSNQPPLSSRQGYYSLISILSRISPSSPHIRPSVAYY